MAKDRMKHADEILEAAENLNAQDNFLFVTTFKRYLKLLDMLDDLEKSLDEHGVQVTKEYVKGRGNIYSNPAINAYVHVTDSANKTVSTLKRILRDCERDVDSEDPLLEAINGD
ncbi:MAG: hypothetical protein J6U74_01825 [Clostridia bacterium]|nr:hypothetical protein [Clostridia bacterium]